MDRVVCAMMLLTLLGLLAFAAGPLPTQPASSSQPALTDAQMLDLVTQAITKDNPKATVAAVGSRNVHLGAWPMPNPLPKASFYCALTGYGLAAPRRRFLAVTRGGQIVDPFDAAKYVELLAAEDKAKWKDEDYLNAALLWVHLTSVANEDGWKLLAKPEDFTAITFNMPKQGPAAAKLITAPKVERKDGQTTVTFYAWHLIGGSLRRWVVQIGPKMEAAKQELGQFGGGGYD